MTIEEFTKEIEKHGLRVIDSSDLLSKKVHIIEKVVAQSPHPTIYRCVGQFSPTDVENFCVESLTSLLTKFTIERLSSKVVGLSPPVITPGSEKVPAVRAPKRHRPDGL